MNATDMKKMTARDVVAHIQDMEGRAHRLATENADLRDEVARLKTMNQAMLNALASALPYIQELQAENYDEPAAGIFYDYKLDALLDAVTAFVGNVETENP